MAYPDYIDYGVAVARGENESGKTVKSLFKFGRATTLSTGNITIWDRNTLYEFYTSSTVLKVASTDGNDATAGTGAISIQIQGLDNNYAEVNETVALEGTTPVTTTADFLRVNRIIVNSSGSNNVNAGNITIIANDQAANTFTAGGVPTTTSNVQGQILAELGQSLMGVYTVPATFTCYVTEAHVSSAITKNITIEVFAMPENEAFQIKSTMAFQNSSIDRSYTPPVRFAPKTTIEVRGRSSSTAGNVSVEWNMILAEGD